MSDGRDFVKRKREKAAAAFKEVAPQAQELVRTLAERVTSPPATDWIEVVKAFVNDDTYEAEDWLKDGFALSIGHWINPLQSAASFLSGDPEGEEEEPEPSGVLVFTLDQDSEAADPLPIAVDSSMIEDIRAGRVKARDLVSGTQTIPADNVRLSVAGERAYVSLVGLGKLGLAPGTINGPIEIERPPSGSTTLSSTTPETIGMAIVTINP